MFAIWAHSVAGDDWHNIAENWRTNQIGDATVENLIKQSYLVQLCQSGSSRKFCLLILLSEDLTSSTEGFWNSEMLKTVMKNYYDSINKEFDAPEEQRKSLDRLLMITLRYCEETSRTQ